MRRSRRHPRPTQFDYLHLRYLVDDLAEALRSLPGPVEDALDVYCGTRPYDDLLPAGTRCVGLDIDNRYGAADVTTREFLPFEDESFDLVISTAGFHYIPDPGRGVAEIRRVLRPGGTVVITIPFAWEYDGSTLEHRYTGPELEALFGGWDEVRIAENGSRGASWALLTGRIVAFAEAPLPGFLRPLFALAYLAVNGVGLAIEALDRRFVHGAYRWPVNLLLSARKPAS